MTDTSREHTVDVALLNHKGEREYAEACLKDDGLILKVKYLVCPGYVSSVNDKDEHYISAMRLIKLYGVHPRECVVLTDNMRGYSQEFLNSLYALYPRRNGNYTIPSKDSL